MKRVMSLVQEIRPRLVLGKSLAAEAKRLMPRLVVPAIIVLVGLAAFGLGRLSGLKEGDRGLVIYPPPQAESQNND